MVRTGLALNQLRLLKGDIGLRDDELRAMHRETPLLFILETTSTRISALATSGLPQAGVSPNAISEAAPPREAPTRAGGWTSVRATARMSPAIASSE